MGIKLNAFLLTLLLMTSFCSCAHIYEKSLGSDAFQTYSKVYFTDFNTAWQAVLEAVKSAPLDVTNREGGYLQTKWQDNTAEKNFVDSFGSQDSYVKAQARYKLNIARGFYNGRSSVRITVQKEQVIQKDILEGWRPAETDSTDENTLLYRIGRLIAIKMKLTLLEEERLKSEELKF